MKLRKDKKEQRQKEAKASSIQQTYSKGKNCRS
jgi:hypothetical protein